MEMEKGGDGCGKRASWKASALRAATQDIEQQGHIFVRFFPSPPPSSAEQQQQLGIDSGFGIIDGFQNHQQQQQTKTMNSAAVAKPVESRFQKLTKKHNLIDSKYLFKQDS
jgi:hypothetical protein